MRLFILKSILLLVLAGLAGCASSPSSKFYLLEPANVEPITKQASKQSVMLSPVRIAHYLDRAQIVVAEGENRYHLSEFDRWAEGLDHNITRVLQQNLGRLLPIDVVSTLPTGMMAIKVSVNMLEFHVDAQGQAKLTVQWQVTRDQQTLANRQQTYVQPADLQSYSVMVAALNTCLNRFSQDLANELQGFIQG